jgi:hypothetical protein
MAISIIIALAATCASGAFIMVISTDGVSKAKLTEPLTIVGMCLFLGPLGIVFVLVITGGCSAMGRWLRTPQGEAPQRSLEEGQPLATAGDTHDDVDA